MTYGEPFPPEDVQGFIKYAMWKYRSWQLKKLENGKRILEIRLFDYKGEAKDTLRETVLMEMLLGISRKMAENGEKVEFMAPRRTKGQSINSYWKKLGRDERFGKEQLRSFLRKYFNRNEVGVVFDSPKILNEAPFRTNGKASYAFEREFADIIPAEFLWPLDPSERKALVDESDVERKFSKLGIVPGEFSIESQIILGTRYTANTFKYPHLHPDLHMEESGNLEIKGSGLPENSGSFSDILALDRKVADSLFTSFPHYHFFIPESKLKEVRQQNKVDDFVKFLSMFTTATQVGFYSRNIYPYNEIPHEIDSWSIDRFSSKDLKSIAHWLSGKEGMSNLDHKYHIVGVRPVEGGLDLELRGFFDYSKEGVEQTVRSFYYAIENLDFGCCAFGNTDLLFHDFVDTAGEEKFKISNVIQDRYPHASVELLNFVHKLQFEIYKPSMGDFMEFRIGDVWWELQSVPASQLDTEKLKSNYESNMTFPIQKWEEILGLNSREAAIVRQSRAKFLERVYDLALKRIEDSDFRFLNKADSFLYLADYLRRSSHPSRPNFEKYDRLLSQQEQIRQKEILEELVFTMRSFVRSFVDESGIADNLQARMIAPEDFRLPEETIYELLNDREQELDRPRSGKSKGKPTSSVRSCKSLFINY
ncbi:MAG: hypothetical protein CL677_09720 [Bdellovibrionaceae bacterium]|nr:hypothetical protein [Pseudobdellovibrionaceae bacterium]|tara:strand:+ start:53921 stop:55864 length:1944 start_codon:yes stop_codon:yes gene_type:complete